MRTTATQNGTHPRLPRQAQTYANRPRSGGRGAHELLDQRCKPWDGAALAATELTPDVQEHDKGNEEQAEHEHRRRPTAHARAGGIHISGSQAFRGLLVAATPLQPSGAATTDRRELWSLSCQPPRAGSRPAPRTAQGVTSSTTAAWAATSSTTISSRARRTSSGQARRRCRSAGCQRRRHPKACCPRRCAARVPSGAASRRRSPGARPNRQAAW